MFTDKRSTFLHLLFSVEPKTPEFATEDWQRRAEESVTNYVRKNCAEGVFVKAVHGCILRLEVAIRFSGQSRDGESVRRNVRTRSLQKSLPGLPANWTITAKILGQVEDARHAIYEHLRARTVPQAPGGWRMVLDCPPREQQQLPASLIASAPGPAGGVTVSGGGGAAVGERTVSGICAAPAAGDVAKFFSVTITVKAEPCSGDRSWIDNITGAVEKHVRRNSAEALLVQSVVGGCLTLSGAMRFGAPHNRNDLRKNLRARQVMKGLPPGVGDEDVECIVSARSEDERHAVYETLRRMAAAAGPWEAGQHPPSPPLATRTLVVLDIVAAAAEPPAPSPAGGFGHVGAGAAGAAAAAPPRTDDAAAPPRTDDAAGPAWPGTLAGPNCSRVFEVTIFVYVRDRDIVRASLLADQASVFFRESQADYTLAATWTELEDLDHLQLTCVVLTPGPVAMGDIERRLRSLIGKNDDVLNDDLRVTAEPITDAKFAERGELLGDPACQLAVHYTHATDTARRPGGRRAGAKRQRNSQTENSPPAAPAAAVPSPPAAAPLQPPAPAASLAAVVADLPPTEFGTLAAAVSEQHAALKASFKAHLESWTKPRFLRLRKRACYCWRQRCRCCPTSPVSWTTRLSGSGLWRRTRGFGRQLTTPCLLCIAQA